MTNMVKLFNTEMSNAKETVDVAKESVSEEASEVVTRND